jgi:hypothetical protein
MAVQELYDLDFFEWTQRNAELLRQGCIHSADISHIAEELADMGKRDLRDVESCLSRLILHLLKWQFQPAQQSAVWRSSIDDSREQLEGIFEQSPSLRRLAEQALSKVYQRARKKASNETGLPDTTFPAACPYNFGELLDDDFLPKP